MTSFFKLLTFSASVLIVSTIGLTSCKNSTSNNAESQRIVRMQQLTDSTATLYLQAINKIKSGASVDSVRAEFEQPLAILKDMTGDIFDTISVDYKSHKITDEEYDQVRSGVIFDTTQARYQELLKLGLDL